MCDIRLLSLTQLTEYVAERGVPRSRKELQRRAIAGKIGQKVGNQWVFTVDEADELVKSLKQGS